MTFRAAVLALVIVGTVAAASAAQTPVMPPPPIPPPDPPGPYVIDVRGTTLGAPQDARFYPPVPTGTRIPTRAWGLDLGAHVYLFRIGKARVGLGADLFRFRGTAAPPAPVTNKTAPPSTTPPSPPTTPDITATISTIAPQVSLNFGSATGWSYVSAGLGRAQVNTERSAFDKGQADTRESGSVTSQNFGGGARWFTSDHLAFTFDVRFHLLSPAENGTPRTRIVSASAGISIR